MTDKVKKILIVSVTLVLTFAAVQFIYAANSPGSSADPLVSQSYVDQKINSLKADYNKTKSTVDTLKKQVNGVLQGKVVNVAKGKTITLKLNAQAVIFSGKGLVSGNSKAELADVTSGKIIKNGKTVPVRHLIISAGSDGRGIKASSAISLLVSGEYSVK